MVIPDLQENQLYDKSKVLTIELGARVCKHGISLEPDGTSLDINSLSTFQIMG